MWFFPWLRNRTPKRSLGWSPGLSRLKPGLQQRPAARRFRPRLEALEDRWLPTQIGLTISSLADAGPGTLRAAIQTADAGSPSDKFTIGFSVTGTIDLQSPLPYFLNTVTIQGPGASNLTVERAAGVSFTSPMVRVAADQTASLSGLTIANGDDRGIITAVFSTLTISNCAFTGNSAPLVGGGAIYNGWTMTVRDSTFSGNSAASGGAIQNGYGASMIISGCTFTGNVASPYTTSTGFVFGGTGGAIANSYDLAVRDCTFSGNSAVKGGAVYCDAPGWVSMAVSGCTFRANNTATDSGGAIYNLGTATLQGCTLSKNSAGSAAGGIFNGTSGTLTVKDSTVLNNVAPLGADLYNLGVATLNDTTVGVTGP
jgi:predicted outer membrane repeat protein